MYNLFNAQNKSRQNQFIVQSSVSKLIVLPDFLVEVLLGLMGIIGTVNGRTAVAGFNSFDALSLLGVIAIVIVGMAIGWAIYNYQIKKYRV